MFQKILVANRGEIACRIFRTCKRLGIATVAVHSDADARALHVSMADEAFRIGPAPVAESYLVGEAIIAAAKQAGAQAIHPGYGFLSENPDFAQAVADAGLAFIGPSPRAIRAMGLKDAAKQRMEAAGVPVVPGYHGAEQDQATLAAAAERIGYPVLIKARAGGGGKGMRKVDRPAEFAAALEGAAREAQASFGDSACLVEKWITTPRHIEVQVIGDRHGNVIHLFERDCSLQRRHQKVIEEAPAPGMTPKMRASMGQAAVQAAQAIAYEGAGTIEFIADASQGLHPDRFYFMEMNTRLQVEHPVTEAITGIDLVEWQLRIAAGEKLPLRQDDVSLQGWAMEARLYAEDPARGFLPAIGRLDALHLPEDRARIDSGVAEGDSITPYYDPMIAKIITHGPDRETARIRLAQALATCRIAGTVANRDFLLRLASQEDFAEGTVDTGLIDRHVDFLTQQAPTPDEARAVAALTLLGLLEPILSHDPFDALRGFRLWDAGRQTGLLGEGGTVCEVSVVIEAADRFAVTLAGRVVPVQVLDSRSGEKRLRIGARSATVHHHRSADNITVFLDGQAFAFAIPDPLEGEDEAATSGNRITAPMPGLVKQVSVKAGDAVEAGTALAVLEAMKMEHTLKAPRAGVITEVQTQAGAQVEEGALLILLEDVSP